MNTLAVVLRGARAAGAAAGSSSTPPADDDVVVDIEWSGISTGTERLLWTGRMPRFPGMGYPLVPGYESVGRVVEAGRALGRAASASACSCPAPRCFGEVRGLFGGAASRVVVPARARVPVDDGLGEQGVLLALAATAYHALAGAGARAARPDRRPRRARPPARAPRGAPAARRRRSGRRNAAAPRRRRRLPGRRSRPTTRAATTARICDVSGDAALLDTLIARLAPRRRDRARRLLRRAAVASPSRRPSCARRASASPPNGSRADLRGGARAGRATAALSLDGLITHRARRRRTPTRAYRTAFGDPACLKMVLDWRACA